VFWEIRVNNRYDGLLTVRDLAELFDRTEQTIYLWCRTQGLPVIRIKGAKRDTIRFDLAKVVDWAMKRRKRIVL
jgi:phage terminase Nu1 subunit (DNA packaging protein)